MAKPPPTGPHSDIAGVNRDARAGQPSDEDGSAEQIGGAKEGGKARPDEDATPSDQ